MRKTIHCWAGCAAVVLALVMFSPGADAAGYTQTRYPIVLVPGLFGFDRILGNPYFFQITSGLQQGGARVFVAQLAAANSNEARGEQLLQQVREITALTGSAKVNLIGHSQGGNTARYVLAVRPDLVASLTTVGAPHGGTPVADAAAALPGPLFDVAARVAEGLANLIDFLAPGTRRQDIIGALDSLTTPGSTSFNSRFPAGLPASECGQGPASVAGVRLYSWGSVGHFTNVLDVTDTGVGLTSLAFLGRANDGLVGRCSTHFGSVIRDDYFQNHLDQVNQVLGLTSPFGADPASLFRQHANRLKNAGL